MVDLVLILRRLFESSTLEGDWMQGHCLCQFETLSENVDQKGKIIFNIIFSKCLVLNNPHSSLLLFYYIIGNSELKLNRTLVWGYETWISILVCPLSNLLIYELITAIGHTDINKLSIFSQQKWKYQQTPPVSWNNKLGKQRISSLSW